MNNRNGQAADRKALTARLVMITVPSGADQDLKSRNDSSKGAEQEKP